MKKKTYSISELASKAGVTKRTVHYYVSRGLIPPPKGSGVYSTYNQDHLYRILLIKYMQDQYLPLQKIKEAIRLLDTNEVFKKIRAYHISDKGFSIQNNISSDHFEERSFNKFSSSKESSRDRMAMMFRKSSIDASENNIVRSEEIVRNRFHKNIELSYPKRSENQRSIRRIIKMIIQILKEENDNE